MSTITQEKKDPFKFFEHAEATLFGDFWASLEIAKRAAITGGPYFNLALSLAYKNSENLDVPTNERFLPYCDFLRSILMDEGQPQEARLYALLLYGHHLSGSQAMTADPGEMELDRINRAAELFEERSKGWIGTSGSILHRREVVFFCCLVGDIEDDIGLDIEHEHPSVARLVRAARTFKIYLDSQGLPTNF